LVGEGKGISMGSGQDKNDQPDLKLVNHIMKWIESREEAPISSHLLGKVFTRFYISLNNVSRLRRERGLRLGTLLHFQVVAFMNAVLVEDLIEMKENIC